MPNPAPGFPTDRPNVPPPVTVLNSCAVVLVRTQGPVNLGMVARLCGNLGVSDLRLVAPECEVNCPESRMFSTHSKPLLLGAPIYPTVEAATADCGLVVGTSGDFRIAELGQPLVPEQIPPLLDERPVAKWALVFGNEAEGLNEPELRACQRWVHLHTFGHNISYNLANAVAITLYVIANASANLPPAEGEPLAAREHIESLRAYWFETLDRFQYFRRTEPVRYEPIFRKFLDRLQLTTHDVLVLRGMLAQFNLVAFDDRFDGKPTKPVALPPESLGARMRGEAETNPDG